MEIIKILNDNYKLNTIINIEKTERGSGNTYNVETKQNKYIAKLNERRDFVDIYKKVQTILEKEGFVSSRIIKTKYDRYMTRQGIVLYEYIYGNFYNRLSKIQIEKTIKYIRRYNKALRLVPFSKNEIDIKNYWDKSKSIDFMVNNFYLYFKETNIFSKYKKDINMSLSMLVENRDKFRKLKKQLIHSDLGADNFIYNKDEVKAIIDFTPDYNHEIYSLCQFVYWNYLWDCQNLKWSNIYNFLEIYNLNSTKKIKKEIFNLLLVYAALYRIIATFMIKFHGNKDYSTLEKRFFILHNLL